MDINQDSNMQKDFLNAINKNQISQIEELLKQGLNPNFHEDFRGNSPLHNVRSLEAAKLLLNYNADVNALNKKQQSPIFFARSFEIVELFVEKGANVNQLDRNKRTVLHSARNLKLARFLINAGAKPCLKDAKNISLLDLLKAKREFYSYFDDEDIESSEELIKYISSLCPHL